MRFYDNLRCKAREMVSRNGFLDSEITVRTEGLSTEDAIGNPTRRNFPLVKGDEVLVQADFQGALGQAFTSQPRQFAAMVEEVLALPLEDDGQRAIYVSTINAVAKYLGVVDNTIHCHDDQPERCAGELVRYFKTRFGTPRVGLVGFQPGMLEALNSSLKVRVLDLNPDNIGDIYSGIRVEDGRGNLDEVLEWAEVMLVTGSTLVNGTIENFLGLPRPVIFYGTTIAAAAKLMSLKRFCCLAR